MRSDGLLYRALAVLVLFGGAGCETTTHHAFWGFDPEAAWVEQSQLTFLRAAPDAPPIAATEVDFWVKRGEAREIEIRYASPQDTSRLLRFHVPALSPMSYEGRALQDGDSIKVAITVEPEHFRFRISPAGLQFDWRNHPAILEIGYRWANPDLNGDGRSDAADARIRDSFGIWEQMRPGEWALQSTRKDHESAQARMVVDGGNWGVFSGMGIYALASR